MNERIKIAVLTDSLPYPLKSGGKVCTYNFIDALRSKYEFTLIFPSWTNNTEADKAKLQTIWPDVKLLNCDIRSELVSANENFIFKVKRKFRNILSKIFSGQIHSAVQTSAGKLSFSKPFEPQTNKYISFLERIFSNSHFNIIHVQYAHNLNLFPVLPEKSVKVFELIELQFDVIKDFSNTKELSNYYKKYIEYNSEFLELSYMNLYDAIFTLNNSDAVYLRSKVKFPDIYVSPFGVLDKDILVNPVYSVNPVKIVFSGGDAHYPNVDALEWYVTKIHKLVREKSDIKIHVTGFWSESSINYFKSICQDIIFEGFIDNLSDFLKESIVIVPIRIGGGGLRTKIIYAMANTAPVVTTSIGAFGINAEHDKHYCIADTEIQFADAIYKLKTNIEFRSDLLKNAYSFVNLNFSQKNTAAKRDEYYADVIARKFNKTIL